MSLDTNRVPVVAGRHAGSIHIGAIDEALSAASSVEDLLARIGVALRSMLHAGEALAFLYDLPAPLNTPSSALRLDARQPSGEHEQIMIATRRAVRGPVRGAERHATRAMLYVPLVSGDRLLGAARVWEPNSPLGFTADDVALATAVGRLAGNHIQRLNEIRRLRALNRMGAQLALARDTGSLYQQIHDAARQIVALDAFAIGLLDSSAEHLIVTYVDVSNTRADKHLTLPLDNGPASRAIRSGRVLHYTGTLGPPVDLQGSSTNDITVFETSIHAPMSSPDGIPGVLSVYSTRRDAYSPADVEAVETLALHAGAGLDNARSFEAVRRRSLRAALLTDLSPAIGGSLALHESCAALDRALEQVIPNDGMFISVQSSITHEPPFAFVHIRRADNIDSGSLAELVDLHAPDVIRSAHPAVFTLECGSTAHCSVALVPMLGGEHSTGVLGFIRRKSPALEPWDASDFDPLAPIVTSTAHTIELARLREMAEHDRHRMGQLAEWQRALIRGSEALTHTGDVTRLIDTIAAEIERLLPHHSLAVYVMDEEPDRLTTIRVRERGVPVDATRSVSIGQGIVGTAVLDGAPLLVNSAHLDARFYDADERSTEAATEEHIVAAPLIVNGGTIGAVAICREGWCPFTDDEFQAFTSFVPHFALVINTGRLVARNRATYISAIRALTATIDAKDPLTRGHSDRVARYSRQIAIEMMLSSEEQESIELAALLHDIGKIGVPDDILSKPGPLNASERATMMEHAALGAEILRGANGHEIARLIPLVRHHHEWYQGGGYPDGISGDDIPLGAAIIAVADAFDTMTTKRPYRDAMPVSAALEEARRNASTQFHPLAVDALTSTIETSSLNFDALSSFNPAQSAVSHITPVDVRPVSVLYRIAREIASIGDVDEFLQKVVRIISEELRYPSISILLPDAMETGLVIRADVWDELGSSVTGQVIPINDSLCGWVYMTGRVINVGDTLKDPRFYPPGVDIVRSELAAPLTVDGAPIGVLNAESQHLHAFSGIDERLFVAIASQLAPAVQLAQVHDSIKRAAQRDGLTGIYNHASFYSRLEELLSEGQRIALFIFDVEGLKRINDTAGHLAGDTALRRVAATLDLETRPQDVVARYGGDEFAVIVTDVDEPTAIEMAARLQAAVRGLTWGSDAEPMSISVGVAISGRDGTKATDLVEIADRRMYDVRALERAGRSEYASHRNRRTFEE